MAVRSSMRYPKWYAKPMKAKSRTSYVAKRRSFKTGRLRRRNLRTAGFLGIEKKFMDTNNSGAGIPPDAVAGAEMDNTTMLCLNGIAQGDGESQRDGRKVTITRIDVHGTVVYRHPSTEDNALPEVRILLVLDTQTNGAQFNSEDVLVTGGEAVEGFRNLQHSTRFRVLAETWVKPRGSGDAIAYNSTATDEIVRCTDYRFPFKFGKDLNLSVTYKDTGATVASITDNSLHIMAIKGGGNYGSGQPTLAYSSRIRFVG